MANRYKPYVYKGVRMGSKLETHVAEAFDRLGLRWEYEPVTFCGSAYRAAQYTPDFYLPELDCYVEATGTWDTGAAYANGVDWGEKAAEHIECVKAFHDLEGTWLLGPEQGQRGWWNVSGRVDEVTVGKRDKPVIICVDGQGRISEDGIDWSDKGATVVLNRCTQCGEWSFLDTIGSFACQRCGAYEGDHFCHWEYNLFEAAGLDEYAERARMWAGGERE